MTPQEAADLAARTLVAIDEEEVIWAGRSGPVAEWARIYLAADRERIASDLAGIDRHQKPYPTAPGCSTCMAWPCPDSKSYANGLVRTADLYGVDR